MLPAAEEKKSAGNAAEGVTVDAAQPSRAASDESPAQRDARDVGEVQSLLRAGMRTRGDEELARLLGHRDRRVRLEAQWELAGRTNATEAIVQVVLAPAGVHHGTSPGMRDTSG